MRINQSTISENGIVRPTNVEVYLDRLSENFRAIEQAVAPAEVMVILKANAYGHGLVSVARHMVTLGAAYLGVAFLEEGILLLKEGDRAKFIIPSHLAFGLLGDMKKIPAKAVLVYDIELIKIK